MSKKTAADKRIAAGMCDRCGRDREGAGPRYCESCKSIRQEACRQRRAAARAPALRCEYTILAATEYAVVIQDTNVPGKRSVTNDVEAVVQTLNAVGVLKLQRLFYLDSDGAMAEVTHDGHGLFGAIRNMLPCGRLTVAGANTQRPIECYESRYGMKQLHPAMY